MQIASTGNKFSGENLHKISILFSGKNKKIIANLSSAEIAQREVNVDEDKLKQISYNVK